MFSKRLFLLLISYILAFTAYSQNEQDTISVSEKKYKRPVFIDLSYGGSYFNFRDFATSPLFYYGVAGDLGLFRYSSDENRESHMGFIIGFGPGKVFGTQRTTSATLGYLNIIHTELFKLPVDAGDKWQFKGGGMLNLTGNLRNNSSLYNNSLGMEAIGTLFGSLRAGYDVSRVRHKVIDLKLFKINLHPRKREIFLQLNLGMFNATYRNGYAYTQQSGLLNDYSYFKGHRLKIFHGYRLNSSVEYKIHLHNKNIIKLSYLWDAYHTGKETDELEMARHHFLISFLFKLDKKLKKPGK